MHVGILILGGILSLYLVGFFVLMWRDIHGFWDAVQATCACISILFIGLLMWRGLLSDG